MTDKQDPIAHAARLLREAAEELRQAHAYSNSEGWENETDAKAAYDDHLAAAQALEDWEQAIGAGGVSGPLVGQPQDMPDLSALTERGAKAWTAVDAQGLREGFTAADMATASAQGFRDGVASLAASVGSELVYQARYQKWFWQDSSRECYEYLQNPENTCAEDWETRILYTHPPTAQAEGWRPIETAPKDGTEILLHAPACDYKGTNVKARTTYGHWRAPSDTPRIKYQDGFAPEPEWEDFEPFWASWDGGFTEECPPTHWMPLPPPPTSAEGVEP